MNVLEEMGQALARLAEQVGPAVVGIGGGRAGGAGPGGLGSGVVVAPGSVVTNAHNVRHGEVLVTFADGRTATATVTAADIDADLAVLATDTGEVAAPSWREDEPTIGQPVVGLANPGGHGLRVSYGTVSATGQAFRGPRGRRVRGGVEHTAPLPRGASGGPVVDLAGRLIGINTHRLGEGFYLAVPGTADLRERLDRLARGEQPVRRQLGVGLAGPRQTRQLRRAVGLPDRDGLLVRAVEQDSPAARADIRDGDLIVAAAGQPVASTDDLYDALGAAADDLLLHLVRGVDELDVTVHFGQSAEEGGSAGG